MDNQGQTETREEVEFISLQVPPIFFEDHEDRDLIMFSGPRSDYIEWASQKQVAVRLHPADVADLMNDAQHYAQGEDYEPRLRASARATVASLIRQGIAEEERPTLPPAGWYKDPSGHSELRYWAGRQWTNEVR